MRATFSIAVLLLAHAAAWSAEPGKIVKAGGDLPIPPGGFADLSIATPKSASVVWRVTPAPVKKAADLPTGRFIFGGSQGVTYTVTAIVIDFDAKTVSDLDMTVIFGGSPVLPIPPPPVVVDPPKKGLYFLAVRPNGPATNEFLNTMRLPAWNEVRKAGHTIKDVTVDEAFRLGASINTNTVLPTILPLIISADGKSSKEVPPPLPFPRDDAGVRKLIEVQP